MWLHRTLILILCILTLSCGAEEVKRSMVIVMYMTVSISDEINLLRRESIKLLDNLHRWRGGHNIENYFLLQIGDDLNKIESKVFFSKDYEKMINELNNVKIKRYNTDKSCLADVYKGLQFGLQKVNNDSIFLVFTDAGSNHKDLLPDIKILTQQKRITFYFILTKGCTQTSPADHYHDLVSISNGEIFNVDNLIEMAKHFQHLTQILTGPPFVPSVEIFVDSTMSEFTITVTGRNPIITIFDPKQKYVSSIQFRMLTNIPNIKMIQVSDLTPGRYTIEIVSETSYSGQVQTKSDLQFKYGFSVYEPNSMLETSYAPLKDHNTYLAISASNTSLIDNLDHVELHTSDRRYKHTLQTKSTKDGDLYVTQPFPSHIKPFKIYVYGRDHLKYDIVRLISPVIHTISGDPPEVDVNTNITVPKGHPIHLICRVSSVFNVTVSWSKIELNRQQYFLDSTQSKFLNYTIDKSKTSDSGEYLCTAENIVGKVDSKIFVTVKPPLRLHTPIKVMNTTVGTEMIELHCDVSLTLIHVKVTWMFNGNSKLPEGSQYILPNLKLFNIKQNFNGTYTCIGRTETEEVRDNIQLNVMYPPKILNLFNLNTQSYIDTTQPLEINHKTALKINCSYDGNPIPAVQWINQTGDIISDTSELKIDEYNNKQSGELSCQVQNEMDKDERKIIIIITPEPLKLNTTVRSSTEKFITIPLYKEFESPLSIFNRNTTVSNLQFNDTLDVLETKIISNEETTQNPQQKVESVIATVETKETHSSEKVIPEFIFKPILLQNYNQFENLTEGTPFIMSCPIEIGEYTVTWKLNRKSIDLLKLSNGSIYFKLVQANMKGDVICIASNKADSANASLTFDILTLHDIRVDRSTDKRLFLNDPYVVKCSANRYPSRQLYWLKNGYFFSEENTITFEKIQPADEGNYTCVADSYLGKINKTLKIQVSAYPHLPNQMKSTQSSNLNSDSKASAPISLLPPYDIQIEASTNRKLFVDERYELKCTVEGDPKPSVFWTKNHIFIEIGNTIVFEKIQLLDAGNYTCVANNPLGRIQKTLELQVFDHQQKFNPTNITQKPQQEVESVIATVESEETPSSEKVIPEFIFKPILLQNYNQFENLIEGTPFIMSCPIEFGEYNVSWKLNGKSIDHLKILNGSIYFKSVQANMKGDVICIARNKAGSANASLTFNILTLPYDIRVDRSTNKSLFLNDPYVVKCSANGNPSPQLYWLKNGYFFSEENTITFEKIQPADEGNYTCVADSYLGNINKTLKIQVSDYPAHLPNQMKSTQSTNLNSDSKASAPISPLPPYDIQIEASTNRKLFVDERYELKCTVKGDPKPSVYWTRNQIFVEIGNTIVFEKIQLLDAGNYTCVANNLLGRIQKTLELQVFAHQQKFNPTNITRASNVILSSPYDIQVELSKDKNFIDNERYELKCSAKGYPKPFFFWMKNEEFIKTGNSIAFHKIQPSNNGQYTCVAENYLGNINKTFILQAPTPPQFVNVTDFVSSTNRNNADKLDTQMILQFISVPHKYLESNYEKIIEVNENEQIILNCTMFGEPAPQIKWFKNNNELKMPNQSVLVYKKVLMMNSGIYKCIGSNTMGQMKAMFYVNVKKPVFKVLLSSPKVVYSPGENLIIKCRTSGNPLPTFRIYSDNFSTETDIIFNQPVNIKKTFFQQNKRIYFEGNTIIDVKRAASLNRYGVLTYDGYIGTFGYFIRSIGSKDAGNYTCTATQSSSKIIESITIKLIRDSKNIVEPQHTINITQNLKLFKLECPILSHPSSIRWLRGNIRIIRSNPHLIPNGRYLEIREPQSYHTGPYKCTNGNLEINFKIVVQPVVSPIKLNTNNRREIKIEKGQSVLLQCPLTSNTIYWFEILELQNFTANEILLLNISLHYEVIADLSRTILCTDDPNYRDGEIFQIIVQEKPIILITKTDFWVRLNESFRLECKATGIPEPIIKWYKIINNSLWDVKKMPEYHVLNGVVIKSRARFSDDSNYLCTATNEIGNDVKKFRINVLL